MSLDLRANTAVDVLIGPFVDSTNGDTAETALTIAQADVRLSKNGQNMAQKSDVTSCAHDELGYYNCELDATDTNTEGTLVLAVHESGALPVRHEYNIMAEAAWDSLYVAKDTGFMDVNVKAVSEDTTAADNLESACDNYSATRGLTGTALPAVAAEAAGGIYTRGTGAGQIDQDDNGLITVDVLRLVGTAQSATDLKDFADAGYDPATNKVEGVKLVDTTTTNTDMVGTDSAALASVCTEGRLSELDAANLPTDIAAIPTTAMRGTDSAALASVCTEGRLAELDAANLPTDIAAIPTTAMRGTDNAALASVCTEGRLAELDAANMPADIDAIPTTAMRGTDSAATAAKQDTMETTLNDVPTTAEFEARTLSTAGTVKLEASVSTIVVAAAAAGTLSTTQMTTNLSEATDDHYNGRIVIWTSGVLINQATDITDYDGGTKLLTYTAVTEAPSDGDTFVIV